VSLADVDSGNNDMLVTISVDRGFLSTPFVPNEVLVINATGESDRSITLIGRLVFINLALYNLEYVPPRNWNSMKVGQPDIVHLYVNDLGHSSHTNFIVNGSAYSIDSKQNLSASADISVLVVQGVNHAPYVRLPGAHYNYYPCESKDGQLSEYQQIHPSSVRYQCQEIIYTELYSIDEDTASLIDGIAIGDVDEKERIFSFNLFKLTVKTSRGKVKFLNTLQHGVRVLSGNALGDVSVVMIGTLSDLNNVLEEVIYTPPLHYYGPDYLSVRISDQIHGSLGKSSNETLPIFVHNIPSAPIMNADVSSTFYVLEDERLPIAGVNITDPDFLEIIETSPTFSEDNNNNNDNMYPFNKSFDSWNKEYFRAQQSGLLRVHVHVKHGRIMFASISAVTFSNVPNATVETKRLSSFPNADATFEQRNVFLGTVVVGNEDVSFSGSPRQLWWKDVILEGRLGDLNRALSLLTYWPDNNWNSGTTLSAVDGTVLDDSNYNRRMRPNYSEGHLDEISLSVESIQVPSLPTSVAIVRVQVAPCNDAPVLVVKEGAIYDPLRLTGDLLSAKIINMNVQYTHEDSSLLMHPIVVRDVDVNDDSTFITVTMTSTNGTIILDWVNPSVTQSMSAKNGSRGWLLLEGTGSYDSRIVFYAPIHVANSILAEVVFVPEQNYFGKGAHLAVSVSDLGNIGLGGPLSDTLIFPIVVLPVNDAPIIRIPPLSDPLLIVDQGGILHVDGATALPGREGLLAEELANPITTTNAFQTGFELWTFSEPEGYSVSNKKNPYGPGQLDWLARRVADIKPGVGASNPRYFTAFKGDMYFQADDGLHGAELWQEREGPQAVQLLDLLPGSGSSSPAWLTVWRDHLYFAANGIDTSWMVPPQHRDLCGSFRGSGFDSRVRFAVADDTVWQPKRRYDCPAGFHWASTSEGFSIFTSDWDSHSVTRNRMWHAEAGAENLQRHGLEKYTQVFQWEKSTSLEMRHEQQVYDQQCGWTDLFWGSKQRTHFRFSDSASTGAFKHAGKPDSFRPDVESQVLMKNGLPMLDHFAGIVCVANTASEDGLLGNELWRSDGSVEGTHRIEDVYAGSQSSNPAYLTGFGSFLFFAATSSVEGRELWRTSGDFADAEIVPFEDNVQGIFPGGESADPQQLTLAGDFLFFAATNPYRGRELFFVHYQHGLTESVGNPAIVGYIDIVSGTESSHPSEMASSGGQLPLLFQANNKLSGSELWLTVDGFSASMVADICEGPGSSSPRHITYFRRRFFFQADDCQHGVELWVSDTSSSGTYLLKDIRMGLPDSGPSFFTPMQSKLGSHRESFLYFSATDGTYNYPLRSLEGAGGSQLWVTDGTAEGTVRAFDRSDNDLYFDRDSLQATYPAQFGTLGDYLYVPANFGPYSQVFPAGGFHANSSSSSYAVKQAVVISDVDTPLGGNVSVTLSVTQGLLLLRNSYSLGLNSPPSLHFLVAESREIDQMMLVNALTSLGHTADSVTDGQSAYEAVLTRSGFPPSNVDSGFREVGARQYDCVLMAQQFLGGTESWDGLQATRLIRRWEADSNSSSRMAIVMMGKLRDLVGDSAEAVAAGADLFLPQPFTDYPIVDPAATSASPDIEDEQLRARAEQQAAYQQLMLEVNGFLFKQSLGLAVSTNGQPGFEELQALLAAYFPSSSLASSSLVAPSLTLQGNLSAINGALQGLFFLASNASSGDAYLNISVSDSPGLCVLPPKWPVTLSRGLPAGSPGVYPVVPFTFVGSNGHSYAERNSSDFSEAADRLCDASPPQFTQAAIQLFVVAVNQPPTIVGGLANSSLLFSADISYSITPPLQVADFDHFASSSTTPVDQQPPISVRVSVALGRLSFPLQAGLSLPQGRGFLDRVTSLLGPIARVNTALAAMQYQCRVADGCLQGLQDQLTVTVDDLGFSGRGGPLSASKLLQINIA